MRLLNILSVCLCIVCFSSCQSTPLVNNDADLVALTTYMCGSFSSQEQALADTHFYHVEIEMVRIWKKDPSAVWIYVEQAYADQKSQPYRQRVYQLQRINDSLLRSQVYEIPAPLRFAGAWQNTDLLGTLNADSLVMRTGCAMIIRKAGEGFYGRTQGKECLSRRKGAAYAISEFSINAHTFLTWERGFDASDKQVWGSEYGRYIFKKIRDYPI